MLGPDADPSRCPLLLVLIAVTVVLTVDPNLLPAQRLDTTKVSFKVDKPIYSAWSSIFRVDAVPAGPDVRALYHDGIIGSAIYRWNGHVASLAHYEFGADPRAIPSTSPRPHRANEAIIGAAGRPRGPGVAVVRGQAHRRRRAQSRHLLAREEPRSPTSTATSRRTLPSTT